MAKRVIIFSQDQKTQRLIKSATQEYIDRYLGTNGKGIGIQVYETLADASKNGVKIGEGDIFAIFNLREARLSYRVVPGRTLTEKLRITSFDMTKRIYEQAGIPYIVYDEKKETREDLMNKLIGMSEASNFKNFFESPTDNP